MSYSQLCTLLGVKQEDPEPSPLHRNVVEIQTFLSSPSGKRAKRWVYLMAVSSSEGVSAFPPLWYPEVSFLNTTNFPVTILTRLLKELEKTWLLTWDFCGVLLQEERRQHSGWQRQLCHYTHSRTVLPGRKSAGQLPWLEFRFLLWLWRWSGKWRRARRRWWAVYSYKKQPRGLNLSFHFCLKLFLRHQIPELSVGKPLPLPLWL